MRIGLINCDHVRPDLRPGHGDYPSMFKALLPDFEFIIYNACDGQMPASPKDCEAWIMTGSKHSVYEDIDWIERLKGLVIKIYEKQTPFVGVCFGHQMIGEALGGKVAKSETGWCVGVHEFEIMEAETWMKPFHSRINVLMSCQDQVQKLPPESKILAHTELCPIAIFTAGNSMLGIQGHPEFSKEYDRALMEGRIDKIGEEVVRTGIESLQKRVDREVIAGWIWRFIHERV